MRGARLILDAAGQWGTLNRSLRMRYYRDTLGWTTIGITTDSQPAPVGEYLAYDGSRSVVPVNQVPYLQAYRAHAARFAHELDDAMGHHSLASAEESDRLAVRATIRDMIGVAWRQYDEWELVDPQELIVGGNFDGTPLWSRYLDDYAATDRTLCSQCNIATFARQVLQAREHPATQVG